MEYESVDLKQKQQQQKGEENRFKKKINYKCLLVTVAADKQSSLGTRTATTYGNVSETGDRV